MGSDVPTKKNIYFVLALLDLSNEKTGDWFLDRENSIESDSKLASSLKSDGNNFLVKNELINAVKSYNKALSVLDNISKKNFTKELEELKFSIISNLMNAYLKLESYTRGFFFLLLFNHLIFFKKKVIRLSELISPKNAKIYYRMGKAYKGMEDFHSAKSYFNKALREQPEDKLIQKELNEIEKSMKGRSGLEGMFL